MIVLYMFHFAAIVSFGKVAPEQREEIEKFGLAVYSWDEFLKLVGSRLIFLITIVLFSYCVNSSKI